LSRAALSLTPLTLCQRERGIAGDLLRWMSSRRIFTLETTDEAQQAVENRERMRRTAGDEKIDGNDSGGPVILFGVVDERPARNRAGADGDHKFRRGDRFIRIQERKLHVLRNRPGDEQA